MTPINTSTTYSGKFVFVSGIAGGREVFLGRAIDEPFNDQLTIEGKPITWAAQGHMNIRPFMTRTNFAIHDPNIQIQVITSQPVINEVTNIFNSSINVITRWYYPLTYRWIESTVQGAGFGTATNFSSGWFNRGASWTSNWQASSNPFTAYFNGFQRSIEQFRRALFTSPQITSTTEMDRITELEGNLAIGFGKITNETAIKFNHIINRESDLTNYFEWIQAFNAPYTATNYISGWYYMDQRMQIAKSWARRQGKAPLVREVNALFKEAVKALNEVILDHCSTLDTLITETCSQYGIPYELFGEMSPFTDTGTGYPGASEHYSYETATGTGNFTNVPIGV